MPIKLYFEDIFLIFLQYIFIWLRQALVAASSFRRTVSVIVGPTGFETQGLQYFGHLMQRTDSLEKILMVGKIEDGRRRG